MDPDSVAILLAAGVAAGFVSGLMGVGGGIVMTPTLHYALGMAWSDAVALSLFVIALQAPIGLWQHHKRGAVDLRIALPLAVGGLAGVWIGIWLEPRLAVTWLKLTFAVLMVFAAWRLQAKMSPRTAGDGGVRWPSMLIVGVAAGIVSRLLGVGGGILTVPVLALMGVPAHLAVGSSLLPVWSNAAVASIVNLTDGLDWKQGIPLAIGAVLAAPGGVWAAHALPERRLRLVVALALLVVAALVAIDALQ